MKIMKAHRTVILAIVIPLALIVASASSRLPTWLTQHTSAEVRKQPLKLRPEAATATNVQLLNGTGQAGPGMQEANIQSNEQAVQARDEADKVKRKPKEERLTKAHSFNGERS